MRVAHQPVQARQGELQEGHLVRRRAARQDEDRLALPDAEARALAWPQPDPVVDFAPPQFRQGSGDQVVFPAPGAAAGDHGIVLCQCVQQRRGQDGRVVCGDGPGRRHAEVPAPGGHRGQIAGEDLAGLQASRGARQAPRRGCRQPQADHLIPRGDDADARSPHDRSLTVAGCREQAYLRRP